MATDDGGEKKFGRTMWDVIASLLKNRFAIAGFILVAFFAGILLVMGKMKVGHGKDGWTFCLPCETERASKVPVKRSFSDILTVPLHSTLDQAKAIVPDLTEASDHSIRYEQTFFGYSMIITQWFEGFTETRRFRFEKSVSNTTSWQSSDKESAVLDGNGGRHEDDLCGGIRYTNFINRLAQDFGRMTFISDRTTNITTSYDWHESRIYLDICPKDATDCTRYATKQERVVSFLGVDGGTLVFKSIKTFAKKESHRSYVFEFVDTCDWVGEYMSK